MEYKNKPAFINRQEEITTETRRARRFFGGWTRRNAAIGQRTVPIDIEAALGRAVYRDLGPTRVAVASIKDIIPLKEKADRARDKADIDHL